MGSGGSSGVLVWWGSGVWGKKAEPGRDLPGRADDAYSDPSCHSISCM